MSMSTLSEAAAAMKGRLVGADGAFESVATDSRSIEPGQLFFALRGERFDASNFVGQAAGRGAAGAVVHQRQGAAVPQIEVADTALALGDLARWWRRRFDVPVLGVTGSNGKTTVKEMTAAILRAAAGDPDRVLVTWGNLNNEIGMPITLLWLRETHRCAVLEMGAGKPGDIAYLAAIGAPTAAVVTNVNRAHLERFGTPERIAETKGAIYDPLGPAGTAVINRDDRFYPVFRERTVRSRQVTFGLHAEADFRASGIQSAIGREGPELRFTLHTPGGDTPVTLYLAGTHNVPNALAAAALATAAGAGLGAVAAGLAAARGVSGRLRRLAATGGATVYDDSYNANPGSVRAALEFLASQPGERWFVLGDMAELGPDSRAMHGEIGTLARELGIQRLYCAGPDSREAAAAFGPAARWRESAPELAPCVQADLRPGVTVLVKGSRRMGMERVVAAIAAEPAAAGGAH